MSKLLPSASKQLNKEIAILETRIKELPGLIYVQHTDLGKATTYLRCGVVAPEKCRRSTVFMDGGVELYASLSDDDRSMIVNMISDLTKDTHLKISKGYDSK